MRFVRCCPIVRFHSCKILLKSWRFTAKEAIKDGICGFKSLSGRSLTGLSIMQPEKLIMLFRSGNGWDDRAQFRKANRPWSGTKGRSLPQHCSRMQILWVFNTKARMCAAAVVEVKDRASRTMWSASFLKCQKPDTSSCGLHGRPHEISHKTFVVQLFFEIVSYNERLNTAKLQESFQSWERGIRNEGLWHSYLRTSCELLWNRFADVLTATFSYKAHLKYVYLYMLNIIQCATWQAQVLCNFKLFGPVFQRQSQFASLFVCLFFAIPLGNADLILQSPDLSVGVIPWAAHIPF